MEVCNRKYTAKFEGEDIILDGKDTLEIKPETCQSNYVYDTFLQRCRETVSTVDKTSSERNASSFFNITNCLSPVLVNYSDVMLLSNDSIFVKQHGKVYNMQQYHLQNNSFVVCSSFSANFSRNVTVMATAEKIAKKDVTTLELLTYLGGGLSVMGLLVLLGVYLWFSEMRNLPGKVMMSLASALLIYQVCFFLTGQTERRGVCSAVAIVLHYFLLASFTWMSVMAFDIAKTFTSKGRKFSKKEQVIGR